MAMASRESDREPGRARVDRWRTSAEVLAAVRADPGLTRVELARRLALSSASATEVLARLRGTGWLCEHRAPVTGRGRPTTVVDPDPDGPQVIAVDLRHEDWTCAVAGLDGVPAVVRSGRHDPGRRPEVVLGVIARAVAELVAGPRPVVAVGVGAPAPVVGDAFAGATELEWESVDVHPLAAAAGGVPVLVDNDATLAGVAESRTGAAAGVATALYLTVEVGLGGVLVLDGLPQRGRAGSAGEFGHLPFGDPAHRCPCGATGCWGREVDGHALARHLQDPEPGDPRTYALDVLSRDDDAARAAVDAAARALGRGVAGLVNAHAPDTVVLGGLGTRLRAAPGFAIAYADGLMGFHRGDPCPVTDAVHGDDAALHGAAALALDHATSAEGLASLSP
jgi:predicted NBD/HSP70 family sugar kinase